MCEYDPDYIMLLIELQDNQMKVERLYYWPTEEKPLLWYPYRENFLRPHIRNDPIVKFKYYIDRGEYQYGVTLR
jgi:hypothetical protein